MENTDLNDSISEENIEQIENDNLQDSTTEDKIEESDKESQMINDSQYRKSWSFFPTGVSILATQDDNKNYLGMTANSVMSISLSLIHI